MEIMHSVLRSNFFVVVEMFENKILFGYFIWRQAVELIQFTHRVLSSHSPFVNFPSIKG